MKTIKYIISAIILVINSCQNLNKEVNSTNLTSPQEKANEREKLMSSNTALRPSSKFKITIDRKISSASCTQGYILVNNEVIAYTLELPDFANKDYISSIPKDAYTGIIRTDGPKGWRVELLDVPSRENIQIHIGNFTSQIEGCILIGTKVDIDNCSVLNNYKAEAIKKLQDMFNKFTTKLILEEGKTDPIEIEVEITGI